MNGFHIPPSSGPSQPSQGVTPITGYLPPPGTGGFLSRFGGPIGLLNYIYGGPSSVATPLSLIGAAQSAVASGFPMNPTQEQYGQMLTGSGGATATSGPIPDAPEFCRERDPETTPVSGAFKERIRRFDERLRMETYPLATPGAISNSAWNQVQMVSFKTREGIAAARQLLWYVKARIKGRTGKAGTQVRYRNRSVDLLDPSVEPSSYDSINEKTPLFGEHIAARESRAPTPVIGTPLSSDELWAALRRIVPGLKRKLLDCQISKGLNGDDWVAFEQFVRDARFWNSYLTIDGDTVDFIKLYKAARGADEAHHRSVPMNGAPLTRNTFWTIEDRRITVEDRQIGRNVPSGLTVSAPSGVAPSSTPVRSSASDTWQSTSSGVGVVEGDQGAADGVPDSLVELFEEFFALPRFRFDMPTRKDGDPIETLAQSYAIRYYDFVRPDQSVRIGLGEILDGTTQHIDDAEFARSVRDDLSSTDGGDTLMSDAVIEQQIESFLTEENK